MNPCLWSTSGLRAWVWWVGCLLLCVVPFLSSWRSGPLSGMYLESGALLFALLTVAATLAVCRRTRPPLPRATWFWLALALALAVQARVMDLPYHSQSDLAAAVCVVLAGLSWAARVWVWRLGQRRAVQIFAWALLAGALLQSLVCVLQFTGHTAWLPGLLAAPSPANVYGQLAQRNHLGHYLMWGVLALCYLWHERRIGAWLALLFMLWLTGILGLVGSRTIMAYVIALGLALGFWRWRGGREANRLIVLVALAIGLVLFMQLALSPLIEWLGGAVFQSGAERMDSRFAQSGRRFEWQKAVLLIQAQPWFGYGWGGFAYHAFAETGAYPQGFRPYETQVLFTHSHNLVLELLVSLGGVGAALLAAAFVWVLWPLLRRPFSPASMILGLLMLVSLCHSMVEYPLWYVYFLAVFALFMALTPAAAGGDDRERAYYWLPLALCLALAAEVVRMGVEYQELLRANRKADTRTALIEQVADLKALRQRAYWLQYYVDMTLVHKANAEQAPLPSWGAAAADLAARYRPYSNTFVHAHYLAQAGREDAAAAWMARMAHYYPDMMPFFLMRAHNHPQGAGMVGALEAACTAYQAQTGKQLVCTPPTAASSAPESE